MKQFILLITLLISSHVIANEAPQKTEHVAVLQILDKITGRISRTTISVGDVQMIGNLEIRVRSCHKAPMDQEPDIQAFLEIVEHKTDEDPKQIFSNWMFALHPAITSLEHPVYDIILLDCE